MDYKAAVDYLYANGPYTFDELVRVAQLCDGMGWMKRVLDRKVHKLSGEDFRKLLTAQASCPPELWPQLERALCEWEFEDITHKTPDVHIRVLAGLSEHAERAFESTFYWSDAGDETRHTILKAVKQYAVAGEDRELENHKLRMEKTREKARTMKE